MSAHPLATIGVYTSPSDPYAIWAREAIEHAGLQADFLTESDFEQLSKYAGVVMVGRGLLSVSQQCALTSYLGQQRGAVIFTGSAFGMNAMLGLQPGQGENLSRCWLKAPEDPSDVYPEDQCDIQFVGGTSIPVAQGEVIHASREGIPLVVKNGHATFFGPHVGQTMGMIMMGRGVCTDSIGPGDGTAFTEDGFPRSEDGTNLRFEDRRRVGGCDVPIFADPHVDLLRDLWIRTILHAVAEAGHNPVLLWHLPDNATAAAVCSIDCDNTQVENVRRVAACLAKYAMPATWLVSAPGFSAEVYRALKKWDHEVGLMVHLDYGEPSQEQLRIQYLQIARASSTANLVTVRGVNGYWHGFSTLYEVCEAAGARLCLSKGGVQAGTTGFLFGTCHPFFPIRRTGKAFSIAELPYLAWRIGDATPTSALPFLIQRCHSVNGIFHFGFSTGGSSSIEFERATQHTLLLIRQAKMLNMTAEQVYAFERARRAVKLRPVGETIQLTSAVGIKGLSVLVGGVNSSIQAAGRPFQRVRIKRYGLMFTSATVDIEPKGLVEVRVQTLDEAA